MDYSNPNIQWVISELEKRSRLTWPMLVAENPRFTRELVHQIYHELQQESRSSQEERGAQLTPEKLIPGKLASETIEKIRYYRDNTRRLLDRQRAAILVLRYVDERDQATTARSTKGRRFSCPKCNGKGRVSCNVCDGHGSYRSTYDDFRQTCGYCNGRGTRDCIECDGSGFINSRFQAWSERMRR